MLPTELIQKALDLTGKSMEEMEIVYTWRPLAFVVSIERFCYYLLSEEFIKEYIKHRWLKESVLDRITSFGGAIYEYQSWNPEPIISILSKI